MPSSAPSSVLLVQLSDSHLFAEADGSLLGMKTRESLDKVVELVLAEQSGIDLILASGDLSQDGSVESYEAFREISGRIGAPARWFPGNHDELPQMEQVARAGDLMQPIIDIGRWRITLLDSAVPGSVPGFLESSQLELLERSLGEAPDRHHLVSLHHHPVDIGCEWMKPIGLRNAEALFAIVDNCPQVRAVLWGHVHQEFDQLRDGVRMLASPSTCIQFAPGSVDFKVDTSAPGYRWLRLHDDGRLETGVSRVRGMTFEPDYDSAGY